MLAARVGGSRQKGSYRGFRATGMVMQRLAKLDPSVSGAVRTEGEGFL